MSTRIYGAILLMSLCFSFLALVITLAASGQSSEGTPSTNLAVDGRRNDTIIERFFYYNTTSVVRYSNPTPPSDTPDKDNDDDHPKTPSSSVGSAPSSSLSTVPSPSPNDAQESSSPALDGNEGELTLTGYTAETFGDREEQALREALAEQLGVDPDEIDLEFGTRRLRRLSGTAGKSLKIKFRIRSSRTNGEPLQSSPLQNSTLLSLMSATNFTKKLSESLHTKGFANNFGISLGRDNDESGSPEEGTATSAIRDISCPSNAALSAIF